jgi:hypothetical protein
LKNSKDAKSWWLTSATLELSVRTEDNMSFKVKIADIPSNSLSDSNLVYCSEKDAIAWKKQGKYLRLLGQNAFFVYLYEPHASIAEGQLGMNTVQRLNVFCSLGEQLKLEIMDRAPSKS